MQNIDSQSINQSINVYLRAGFYNKKSRISGTVSQVVMSIQQLRASKCYMPICISTFYLRFIIVYMYDDQRTREK